MADYRKVVWDLMLDAELNVKYWGDLVRRSMWWEKALKITLAVTSSGTIVGLRWLERFPSVPIALASVNLLVAVIFPFLGYSEKIETMANLRGNWRQLCIEYERLWQRAYSGESLSECENELRLLKDRTVQFEIIESRLPDDRELRRRCQQEVRQARGI